MSEPKISHARVRGSARVRSAHWSATHMNAKQRIAAPGFRCSPAGCTCPDRKMAREAGARDRAVPAWRQPRRRRAPAGAAAIRGVRPAIRRRQPRGRRRHDRRRDRARANPDGYTVALVPSSYATSAALYKLPYDPVKSHRADRDDCRRTERTRRAPVGESDEPEGVHRAGAGETGPPQLRLVRHRQHAAPCGRALPAADQDRHGPRSVQGRRPCGGRRHRRADPVHDRLGAGVDPACQERPVARVRASPPSSARR